MARNLGRARGGGNAMMFVEVGKFIGAIGPALYDFGKFLFEKYNGRSDLAIAKLKKLQDQWEGYDEDTRRIDEELAQLKKEGK